jgi:hypothetical protein
MDIPEKALRHSGSLLAGIQPSAPAGFPLKTCGNDERGYAGMTNRAQQVVEVFTEIT